MVGVWGLVAPKKLVKSVFGGPFILPVPGCLFGMGFTFTGETGTGTGWTAGLFWFVPKKLAKS